MHLNKRLCPSVCLQQHDDGVQHATLLHHFMLYLINWNLLRAFWLLLNKQKNKNKSKQQRKQEQADKCCWGLQTENRNFVSYFQRLKQFVIRPFQKSDRQTDSQTHTDRHTDRQTGRQKINFDEQPKETRMKAWYTLRFRLPLSSKICVLRTWLISALL